ncbi:MAG TPA: peptidylprolyl isomerase [Steroidobacteraceae bacterium]|jgi:peptidyl-prolyl cis-trans isomerase SurA|nr:peptidylprolyl isomerase [Steroidobacteraceae bacterium]
MIRILTGWLCASLLLTGAALAQTRDMSSTGVALDRVIAVVNEGVVLQSQLDQQSALIAERLRSQGTQLPPADVIRQQVLERLILQEIQVQRAGRIGVQVSDEMLNEALRDVARRNSIEFEQMPQALEQQGIDYASYREEMRREIMLSLLRQRDVFPRIYVSPRELEQALEREASQAGVNTEYDVSHILLSLAESATSDEMAAVEKLAREIHDRAAGGEDFGQLALAYSKAQSALERGKLGWRRMGQLPQFIGDLVAKMNPGDVSEPVRTPTGFHLVRLDGTRGGDSGPVLVEQLHARHILMRPNEVQDDATTRQRLVAIRDRILAGEDFEALASVTSEDPGSASRGGDLGWTSPGTFDPAFEEALAGLEPDQISEPFRTQFGWHIVQLLGRRTHDQSDELRRQRVLTALRESKVDEETELWLRRLRDEAYVEIRNP